MGPKKQNKLFLDEVVQKAIDALPSGTELLVLEHFPKMEIKDPIQPTTADRLLNRLRKQGYPIIPHYIWVNGSSNASQFQERINDLRERWSKVYPNPLVIGLCYGEFNSSNSGYARIDVKEAEIPRFESAYTPSRNKPHEDDWTYGAKEEDE